MNTQLFEKILIGGLEFSAFYALGSLFKWIITRISSRMPRRGMFTFLSSFISIALKIIGIIIALDEVGVSMNVIMGSISALGVGVSLALKQNMASVASGLQILITRPFKIGDYIKIGAEEGQVAEIELTYTTLLTRDDETVIVPNNDMISHKLKNFSDQPSRRIKIIVPCLQEHIDLTQKILLEAAQSSKKTLKDPAPSIHITGYSVKKAEIELVCWTDHKNYWSARNEIMENAHEIGSRMKPALNV